jgi:hypothetical protein
MKTYKFLAKGATGPFSGFKWPEPRAGAPGPWIDTEGPLALCARGAHVCRSSDLAYWLHDELWETETGGEQLDGLDCLVVRRARLVRRIDAWQHDGASRFVEACANHAAELAARASAGVRAAVRGYIDDAFACAQMGFPAVGAFSAALAVAKLDDPHGDDVAYRRERAWQADWIARILIAA